MRSAKWPKAAQSSTRNWQLLADVEDDLLTLDATNRVEAARIARQGGLAMILQAPAATNDICDLARALRCRSGGLRLNRAWTRDQRIGAALIRRARAVVSATLHGTPIAKSLLPASLIPIRICGVDVTLYGQGILGCWIGLASDLDLALARGAALAAHDHRYPPIPTDRLPTLRIAVSVLYEPSASDRAENGAWRRSCIWVSIRSEWRVASTSP